MVLEQQQAPLNLKDLFGNENPVELEIGIGKGLFITRSGVNHPDTNWIGIEIRRKYLNMARERVEKRPLGNVRLICGEALGFLEEYLPDNSLSVIHVYYPDPWPKKRHHKRRLFGEAFMAQVHRVLKPGGHLLIATDHLGYWEHIQEVLQAQTYLDPAERLPEDPDGATGLTNFAIKYQAEGRQSYRTGYRKPEA
nr:tRNA (guanosine(46)-N7)-methyltransferase TrmB [Acanthopleuribacter pedis]